MAIQKCTKYRTTNEGKALLRIMQEVNGKNE